MTTIEPATSHPEQDPQPIALQPSSTFYKEVGHWSSEALIRVNGHRYAIGYVDPFGTARRIDHGPQLPGPHAYATEQATVITATPSRTTRPELTTEIGATLLIDGCTFRIDSAGYSHLRLTLTDTPPPTPDPLRDHAADIATQASDALDALDSIIRSLDDTGPDTPPGTLTSLRRRLDEASTALTAINDYAATINPRTD